MSVFDKIRISRPKSTSFNLGHEVKLSCNMGDLIPFMCEEVVPGDTFSNKSAVVTRFAPLLAPIMHRVNVYTHFFFVPNRLIWDEWEDFITGGEDGKASPVAPHFDIPHFVWNDLFENGSLGDYLGVPQIKDTIQESETRLSALPFRAYNLIFNEYYRDQNLQAPLFLSKESGRDTLTSNYQFIAQRCWEKDYFTSALPFAQKGEEVRIGSSGDVVLKNDVDANRNYPKFLDSSDDGTGGSYQLFHGESGRVYSEKAAASGDSQNNGLKFDPNGSLEVKQAPTVNDLRKATRLQQWLEKTARAGSRYTEQILAHFGVRSSDARLQRPEYLGGGRSPVSVTDVEQTSETSSTSAQGTLAGKALSMQESNYFKRFFEEHGFIVGILSVLPRTAYQQGLHKKFFREDKFDYYFPEFAQLGEQPILNKELYLSGDDLDSGVFGYTPRYSEYKYIPSRVAGDFRDTLNFWHLGRIFYNRPKLNADFVKCESDYLNRIFAVTDDEQNKLWIQIYNDLRAVRPMPRFGTPTL